MGESGQGPDARGRVVIDGITKRFGETAAVDDVSLSIERGEFLTLLGPSGCGKTTLLRMVAGFEAPSRGRILLGGRDVTRDPPEQRPVNMVFQRYALFPHLDVAGNVAYGLVARGMPRERVSEQVASALELVAMSEFAGRAVQQLSGGQQQRVALARALVNQPEVLLLDEPLAALDLKLRKRMQVELRAIHRQLATTFVYVTHDQGEALTMSNRIAVFNDGAIQQLASPSVLYEEPENAFVAQFIGENNRLMGVVRSVNGSRCTVEIDGGGRVEAAAINIGGVGARTTLSLRPESVRIDPPVEGYPDRFDARIEEIIYMGDHVRVRVDVCRHDDFIIKVPRSREAPALQVGQTRTIGWHPEDCRALDVA